MNETRLRYFEEEDVLHLIISEMIGVEILKASAFLLDTVFGASSG
jgi:hypothetical protein